MDQALAIAPRAWISPVSEANRASHTGTTDHAKSVDEPAHHGEDLEGSDPEFELTVVLHGEHVESGDENPEDGDPRSQGHLVGPELDDLTNNGNLKSEGNGPGKPVIPPVGHTKGRRAEPGTELGEGTRTGDVSGHLTQTLSNRPGQGGDENVRNEGQHRARLEGVFGRDEETRANGASQGNHGNVSGLQVTLDLMVGHKLQRVVAEVVDVLFQRPDGLFDVRHGEKDRMEKTKKGQNGGVI